MHYLELFSQFEYRYWIMFLIVALVLTIEELRKPNKKWRSRDDQIAWRQRDKGR